MGRGQGAARRRQRVPPRQCHRGVQRPGRDPRPLRETTGGEWNVKFAELDSEDQITGNDGRVVERGDFAITAGADDSACYAGSYMATWAPQGDDWRLQLLAWQDVETDLENCK